MNVSEVRVLKNEVEKKILEIILQFEKQTELHVEHITVIHPENRTEIRMETLC